MRDSGTGTVERRPGGVYARLPRSRGRKRLGPFADETEAKRVLAAALEELAAQPANGGVPTVTEFGEAWFEKRAASGDYRSIRRERTRWKQHVAGSGFGEMRIDRVEAADVRAWVGGLRPRRGDSLSPTTRRHALALVHSVLRSAVEAEHLRANPASAVRIPAAARRTAKADDQWDWLRWEEFERLLTAGALAPQQRAIVELAVLTGLRAGEMWALRWDDVENDRGVIRVERAMGDDGRIGPPKSGRSREVPILARTARVLEEQRGRTGNRSLVFWSKKGGAYTTGYDADLPKALRAAKIARSIRFHDLRHSFASLAIQGELEREGLPAMRIEDLRQWLGHADIATTQRYAHLAKDGLRRLIQAPLDSAPTSGPTRGSKVEPPSGIEPETYGLRNRCDQRRNPESQWTVGPAWGQHLADVLRAVRDGSEFAAPRAYALIGEMLVECGRAERAGEAVG